MNEHDAREKVDQSVKDGGTPTQDTLSTTDQQTKKRKTSNTLCVSWNPPEPRAGALGGWDRFVGPGATDAEELLQLVLGGAIAIGGVALFWLAQGQAASFCNGYLLPFWRLILVGGL